MKTLVPRITLGLLVAAILVPSVAFGQLGATVPNWAAAKTYTPARGAITTMGDVTNPLPFIGVTPCRIVDTRLAPGPFGGPAIAGGTFRSFALPLGPCTGLPASPLAYSLNITATNTAGPGFIKVWPQGGTQPLVSTLNYLAGQTVANAAIVPAGSPNAGISVKAGVSTADVIIDINGYYSDTLGNPSNTFVLTNNTGSETMRLENLSTTCAVQCGLEATVSSGWAVYGNSIASGSGSVGVYGQTSAGVGGSHGVFGANGDMSFLGGFSPGAEGVTGVNSFSGVLGIAEDRAVVGVLLDSAGNDLAEGWAGKSGSVGNEFFGVEGILFGTPGIQASGVYGLTSNALANAGRFDNTGIGTRVFINTQVSGVNYDIDGSNRIFAGSLVITGLPKSFAAPHPLDPSKEIRYACLEAPTVDVVFRGTGTLSNGYARIEVPDHFRFTAREGTYMTTLTPVGRPVTLSVESEGPDGITVRGSGNGSFHYVVYAERAETVGFEPVQKNVTFTPEHMEKIGMLKSLPAATRALLVRNGTLNPDGTYNEETARSMGWNISELTGNAAARAAAEARAQESSNRAKN